ncbi:hypothetical protein Q9966_001938 [Columba livia]|nr:hypothetical protein Q9966_001938 [Columba livia]
MGEEKKSLDNPLWCSLQWQWFSLSVPQFVSKKIAVQDEDVCIQGSNATSYYVRKTMTTMQDCYLLRSQNDGICQNIQVFSL